MNSHKLDKSSGESKQFTSASAALATTSKNVYVKAIGIVAGARLDGKIIRNNNSDFKKGMAATSLMGSPAGPVSAAVSIIGNAVYDTSSPKQQEALDKFSRGRNDAYNNSLNKINASSLRYKKSNTHSQTSMRSRYKKSVNVAKHRNIPIVKKVVTTNKNLSSKRLSATEQRAANVAKYEAKKRREASRRSSRSRRRSRSRRSRRRR